MLDALVATALDGRDHVGTAHLATLPPALARLVVRRLAEDAARAPVPAVRRRVCPRSAWRDGALDLGERRARGGRYGG